MRGSVIKWPVNGRSDRYLNVLAGVQLLMTAEIHRPVKQRNHVRIKSLPVGVLQMVLLTTLVLKTLYNCKGSWIMHILHNQPVQSLLVFAIDSCSFDELGLDTRNGIRVIVGVEVD